MLKILIIDDEARIRKMLADIVNIKCTDATVVGFAQDVKSGIAAIEELKPDIILLDIQLPDGTGFNILEKTNNRLGNFHVIFITAFEEYAIKAFKFSAMDYILKPVDPKELLKAIDKCRTQDKNDIIEKFQILAANLNKQIENKRLVLKTQDTIYMVEVQDIIRCESQSNYTVFYISGGKKIMVSRTIGEFEELLSDMDFFRIHNSHIINLKFLECYEKKEGGFIIMKDKSVIPVSHRKKDLFLKKIQNL